MTPKLLREALEKDIIMIDGIKGCVEIQRKNIYRVARPSSAA